MAGADDVTSKKRKITLRVENNLREPTWTRELTVETKQQYLLGVMQEAADKDKSFRFSATYYDHKLGWMVDAYDFVYATYSQDKSFWQILDGKKEPTKVGVSSYQPQDGETVTFRLFIHQNPGTCP